MTRKISAEDLRAIAEGRLMLNVRNGVTVSRSMLAKVADDIDALSSATPAEEDPHKVMHVYEGDGGVIIRENGNVSTFGVQSPEVIRAFNAASALPAGEVGELVKRMRYSVGNPSAWDAYDDGASDLLDKAATALTSLSARIEAVEDALERAEQQLDYGQVDAAHQIILRALSRRATTGGEHG